MSPRKKHVYKPLGLKARAWLTAGAVALGGAGVVSYAVAAGPVADHTDDGRDRRPAAVHTVDLETLGTARRGLAKQETKPFSGLMLTWKDPEAEIGGKAQARARSTETGEWSDWKTLAEELDADGSEVEGTGVLGGTEVMWTGSSDAVEVRISAQDGTVSGLAKGMDLKLIDPGVTAREARQGRAGLIEPAAFAAPAETTPAVTPSGSESATPPATTAEVPTAPPSTVVKPPVITQAEWGASTEYNGTPEYDTEVKAVVVHHTGVDVDNGTSCLDSPERVRTIQQGHLAKGWYDIGYHFLVDRCGRIFEGRSGGMDLPIHGAHDYGFNTDTIGISFLANTETMKPTRAALDSIARVAAWRLGQYKADPAGTVTLTSNGDKGVSGNLIENGASITLPRIFGHRDTNSTVCPGANLYAKLPLIRALAAAPGVSHALNRTDVNGDGVTEMVAGTPRTSSGAGSLTVVPGGIDGPEAQLRTTLSQNSHGVPGASESGDSWGAASALGDVNGDGYADLAVGAPGENDTTGHTDSGAVTVLYGPQLESGKLYSTASATRASGEKLGTDVSVGDFDADGKADVFSVAPGKPGRWWAFGSSGTVRSGYLNSSAYTSAVAYASTAAGDFNRDGFADAAVSFRDPSGVSRLLWLKGSSSGLQRVGILSARGGRSLAAGDLNGDGFTDLAVGQPAGAESGKSVAGGSVTMVKGSSTGLTSTGAVSLNQDSGGVPGTGESGDALGTSVSSGDFDLDGFEDVLAGAPGEDITRDGSSRGSAGMAFVFRGSSSGMTGSGALGYTQDTSGVPGATESGDRLGSSVLLTDLSGWGRADVAIGVDGEDSGDGTVLQMDSGSSGISTSGAVYYGRSQLGTPAGARLGQTLAP